jgi:hypothetical protein
VKTFYSAQEIEDLARQGLRELVVDDNVVLTDLARQMAGQVGLRLVMPGQVQQSAPSAPRSAAVPAPFGRDSVPASAAPLPAKPRGCQHGPLPASTPNGHVAAAPSGNGTGGGQMVNDLVGLVKQMSKR